MNKRAPILLTSLMAAVGLSMAPVSKAAAQTVTIDACYVPGSGTVYVINAPGAPDDCRSHQHVRFSWSTGIPTGRCFPGMYMVGIGANGAVLCEPLPGDNSFGAFAGTYELDSPLAMECTGGFAGSAPTFVSARVSEAGGPGKVHVDFLDTNGATFFLIQLMEPEGPYEPSTHTFVIDKTGIYAGLSAAFKVLGSFNADNTVGLNVDLSFSMQDGSSCTMTGTRTGSR